MTTMSIGAEASVTDDGADGVKVPTIAFVHLFDARTPSARSATIKAVWATVEAAKKEINGTATVRSSALGFDFERGLDLLDVETDEVTHGFDHPAQGARGTYINAQLVESTGVGELERVLTMAPTQSRPVEVFPTPTAIDVIHAKSHAIIESIANLTVEIAVVSTNERRRVAIVALSSGRGVRERMAHIVEFSDESTAADVVDRINEDVGAARLRSDSNPTDPAADGSSSERPRQRHRGRSESNATAPTVRVGHANFVGMKGVRMSSSTAAAAKLKTAHNVIKELKPGGVPVALVVTLCVLTLSAAAKSVVL